MGHPAMELCGTRSHCTGSELVPLHLNSVTQFAAFSGLPNGLRHGWTDRTECEIGETRMDSRGHRAIRALAVFLVLALGVAALLPLIVRGANQVNGVISTCVTTTPFVSGASVTLLDANGINAPLTTTTGPGGVYAFTPPTGSYMISVTASGYYAASSSTPPTRFDGSRTITISLCMNKYGSPPKVLSITVLSAGSPVSGASVAAYNTSNPTGRTQLIVTNTTNAAGLANLTLWPAVFLIRASAPDLQTDQSVDVSLTSSTTINLVAGPRIFGHVLDSSNNFLDGVVAWLYNPAAANSSAYRLIPATVSGSLYDIHAPPGTYTLIVDADHFLSHKASVTRPTTTPNAVVLQPAPPELYQTTVGYGANDWSNVTIWRNVTLNADSTLPGLGPANLRDLRLQIDSTLGNGDGSLSAGEIAAFCCASTSWLAMKGAGYVTTDAFLTTNGRAYNSSLASFSVTVSPTVATPGAKVWINTTTTYALKQTPPFIAR